MSRPATISTEQILEAARAVFLEKGIRATTAEVAKRAGVAEGSIFKRFPTKSELFRSAMDFKFQEPEFLLHLQRRVGQGDLQENLLDFATQMLGFFRRLMPIVIMSWSNREGELPSVLLESNPPPLRALKHIAAYFEAEIRLGRLRRHDPEILARLFIGSIQNYVFFELLLSSRDELPMPDAIYLRGIVNLIWNGAAPAGREET